MTRRVNHHWPILGTTGGPFGRDVFRSGPLSAAIADLLFVPTSGSFPWRNPLDGEGSPVMAAATFVGHTPLVVPLTRVLVVLEGRHRPQDALLVAGTHC